MKKSNKNQTIILNENIRTRSQAKKNKNEIQRCNNFNNNFNIILHIFNIKLIKTVMK